MRILVDVMGGDNAPKAPIQGALDAVREDNDVSVVLIGDETVIKRELEDEKYDASRVSIRHTTETIDNNESPAKAVKAKRDSSLVVGFKMIKEGEGDAFVSAGSSGALLVASVMFLRRIKGVERPSLATVIPNKKGNMLLLDSGLNLTMHPKYYLQFGYLGSAYCRFALGTDNPRVALVNVGSEEEKGNMLIHDANELLKESNLNYTGYIETKDVFEGNVDVVVTDGFTGNVILKLIEGLSKFILGGLKQSFMSSLRSKIGAVLVKPSLKNFKNLFDVDVNGGAPILGVDGIVLKTHGSSRARTFKYVIIKANKLAKSSFLDDVRHTFIQMPACDSQEE